MEGYSGDAELESVSSVATDMGSMFANNTSAIMMGKLKQASKINLTSTYELFLTKIFLSRKQEQCKVIYLDRPPIQV
jgi:hypothetical protein